MFDLRLALGVPAFFELHIPFEVQRKCPIQARHFDRISPPNGYIILSGS